MKIKLDLRILLAKHTKSGREISEINFHAVHTSFFAKLLWKNKHDICESFAHSRQNSVIHYYFDHLNTKNAEFIARKHRLYEMLAMYKEKSIVCYDQDECLLHRALLLIIQHPHTSAERRVSLNVTHFRINAALIILITSSIIGLGRYDRTHLSMCLYN